MRHARASAGASAESVTASSRFGRSWTSTSTTSPSTTSPSTTSGPPGRRLAVARGREARREPGTGRERAERHDRRATARPSHAITGRRTSARVTGMTKTKPDDVGEEPRRQQQRAADEHEDGVRELPASGACRSRPTPMSARHAATALARARSTRRGTTRTAAAGSSAPRRSTGRPGWRWPARPIGTTRNSARITAPARGRRRRCPAGRPGPPLPSLTLLAASLTLHRCTTRSTPAPPRTCLPVSSALAGRPRTGAQDVAHLAGAVPDAPGRHPPQRLDDDRAAHLAAAELALDEGDRHLLDPQAARGSPAARGRPGSSSPARRRRPGRASPASSGGRPGSRRWRRAGRCRARAGRRGCRRG